MAKKKYQKRNSTARQVRTAVIVVAALVAVWWLIGHAKELGFKRVESVSSADNVDVVALMEVNAPEGLRQQIVAYEGYTTSFNADLRIPNYVVYELTRFETQGTEPRHDKFMCDTDVEGCPTTADYKGSGYDRGHMAPAADMKWSNKAMLESFFLTNICPQNHSLNSGGWKRLEEKVRLWADRDSAVIVVSGPIVQGHINRLESGVAVPTGFFKVLLAPFATPKRAIAFIYKNEGGQKVVERQAVSVDEVEALTGLDFFSSLPDEEENEIEKTCDYYEWNN